MLGNWISTSIILLAASISAWATDSNLDKQLTATYRDQVVILRHPFKSDYQDYDANGILRNYFPEGAWTLYGRVVVKKISVDPKELRLEGRRVFYKLEKKKGRLVPLLSSDRVNIRIALNNPLASVSDARTVLAHIFASTREDVLMASPPYWQAYLKKQWAAASGEKIPSNEGVNVHPASGEIRIGERIFHFGEPGVTNPKPQYTPEPDFTDAARKANFGGTLTLEIVVDKTGKVSDIQISKPLGLGLDDNAVETVKTWRFTPGTLNGETVSTGFFVETDFHLGP